ncbi:MAG TPA: hypothetical protein DDZ51_05830 [Planctomycetaceae bacterium]|nr:hypothetical protein [Planctomycetaceae bacterium]
MSTYPSAERKRSGYFARYAKSLFRCGAVMQIGKDPVMLALLVASREDRLHYNKPPMIWRAELMEQLGIGSPKGIIAARQAAIDAGLIFYAEGTRTQPPKYWSLVPDWLDPYMRRVPKRNTSESTRSELERETERKTEHETERILEPITQYPPKGTRNASLDHAFQTFWEAYPLRNGKRVGKADASKAFAKIKPTDHADLMLAVKSYAATCGDFAKDPVRFLRNDFWRDHLVSPEPPTTTKRLTPMTPGRRKP